MTDPTCSDADLARAIDYARTAPAAGLPRSQGPLALLCRAMLRLEAERYRLTAELAAERGLITELRAMEEEASASADRWRIASERRDAELAAIDRALAGEPVPPDASERVRRVAELRAEAHPEFICIVCCAKAPTREGVRHADGCPCAPAPEDDGLTAEDRAKGWRWTYSAQSCVFTLRAPTGGSAAWVGTDGWETSDGDRGPETGAAGQRAACDHLRKAGVL